jgi:(S)-sulfolactate dehydrogenase
MSTIVITEFMDEAAIQRAFAGRDVVYDPKLVDDPARLSAALADCRALIVRNRTQVRAALLDQAPKLEVVGRLGVGLDNIDVDACQERGISVFPPPAPTTWRWRSTSSPPRSCCCAAPGSPPTGWWPEPGPRMELIGRELSHKRIGLVGYGAIAQLTAEKARALGMKISAYDPFLPDDHPGWRNTSRRELGPAAGRERRGQPARAAERAHPRGSSTPTPSPA